MSDPNGCDDCAAHPAGICWSHKCKAIRAGSTVINVGEDFKKSDTLRERNRRQLDDMRATGRSYSRVS